MVPKTFNILFLIRKPNGTSITEYPIFMRITVDGTQKEFSIGRKCPPEKWNKSISRSSGTKEEFRQLNNYLDALQQQAYEAKIKAIESYKLITPEFIIDIMFGRDQEKPKMIIEVFQEHNNCFAELVGKEVVQATMTRYEISLTRLKDFIIWKYQKDDLPIKDINYEFIENYMQYLKVVKTCNTNSAGKYLVELKKIISQCIKRGIIIKDPFFGFKIKKTEVKRKVLTMEEIACLANKNFAVKRLENIRDIFLFCCYTGLAYIDIKQLKRTHIQIGIDGEDWIFTTRQKTDVDTRVPLLPFAKAIIEKYLDHPQCIIQGTVLPVPCNQKMNAYLKEIADVCGITKTLTTHIARHTFATTVTLSHGVPIETVSKLLGHKNLKTTQHYAKILDLKVSSDVAKLRLALDV
ncbi:MAG: site-specific integrase [Bacteroidota bacterium]|nr:site-specific integrase [Bacteroidota bacterium]